MRTRDIVFGIAVIIILGFLIYSFMDENQVCEETKKTQKQYKDEIADFSDTAKEPELIHAYNEYIQCFGADEDITQSMIEHFSEKFLAMQTKEEHDRIVAEYRDLSKIIGDERIVKSVSHFTFNAYSSVLDRYGADAERADFVLNTTEKVPACNAYIAIYEDMKKQLPDYKQELFEIEKTAQICYVLKANTYRYRALTEQDIDTAIDNYEKTIELEIITPAYNHAEKVLNELWQCSLRGGTCIPSALEQDCRKVIGPSSGWEDCSKTQICCSALT